MGIKYPPAGHVFKLPGGLEVEVGEEDVFADNSVTVKGLKGTADVFRISYGWSAKHDKFFFKGKVKHEATWYTKKNIPSFVSLKTYSSLSQDDKKQALVNYV